MRAVKARTTWYKMSVWLNACTVLQVDQRAAEGNLSDLESLGELLLDIGLIAMPCSK